MLRGGECKHPKEYIYIYGIDDSTIGQQFSLPISNQSAATQFWLPISRIDSDAVFAVDFWIRSCAADFLNRRRRSFRCWFLNWQRHSFLNCLKELGGRGKTSFWRDQNKDKNTFKPTPNTPPHLMGSINTRRREKVTLPLPKSYLQQLHVQVHGAIPFLLPNRNLNQTSRECLVNVWGRVETLREEWTAA